MRHIALLLLTLFLPATVYAVEIVEKQQTPVYGAQIFVLDPAYNGDLNRFFRELKERGADTVYLRVFHNVNDRVHLGLANPCPDGGVYFASKNVCVVADILKDAVAAGHANGIKVYAWMATRSLSFLKKEVTLSRSFSPGGGTVAGYGANIFNPEVRGTIKKLFFDLAASSADGILIQDDFIIKYNEGADSRACAAFTKETGIACTADTFFASSFAGPDRKPVFGARTAAYQTWIKWKSEKLSDLLYEIRYGARLINPRQKWAVNIYYETPVYPEKGLSWYAQDMNMLRGAGIDYFAVMMYQEQIIKEMGLTKTEFLDFAERLGRHSISAAKNNAGTVFKIQVRLFDNNRTAVSAEDLRLLCARLKRAGGISFVQLPVNKPSDMMPVCR
ncbi:MAG: hypothetical protein LBH05_00660 [Deferribacteraceae bacterium]|jgi:biofilm PGA synthesis lipoprotein PgaB|nr:hypothetical protein [Deferribacteraceae bacterium]